MKRVFVIVAFGILLFTMGCSGGDDRGDPTFRTGSEGLDLRFLPYTPPNTIYDGDNVDFVIEIANEGAYDVRGGKLYLAGFDKNIINIYENYFVFEEIEGKSEYNKEGEKVIIDRYTNTKVSLPKGVDQHTTPIEAIACYEYKTIASFPVCIDTNPRVSKHDGCNVGDVGGGTQGAPIAVSHIDVESGKGRMRFIITIRNVGGGEIIDYNSCPFGYSYNEMGNIRDYEVEISGISLDCQPDSNSLNLDETRQGTIYCQADNLNPDQSAYLTPITITLDYDYKDSTSTTVNIRGDV